MKLFDSTWKWTTGAVLVGGMLTGTTQAAVLGLWEFGGNTIDSTSFASTDTDADSTASSFTSGAGYGTFVSGSNWGFSAAAPANSTGRHLFTRGAGQTGSFSDIVDGSDEATAVTANDYYEFAITPNSGFKLDLTSFTLKYTTTANAIPASPQAGTVFVRSSLDGYTTTLGSYTDNNVDTNPANSPFGTPDLNIDLSSISAYQNVAGPVSFRVYFYELSGAGASVIHRLEDVTINGSAALIPEPASMALLALSGGMLLLNRKR